MANPVGNRFGWHSGELTAKRINVLGDLYIQDDIVFSDITAGRLGVTGGIDLQSTTSAIGIDLGGTFTTAAINIDGTLTGGRAIRIGTKTTGVPISSGLALDAEPANNYHLGLFTVVAASEATSTDELRSAWIRTRVNQGCHVGSNAGWGYGVCGAEIQLKVYADTAATNMYSWQNSGIWAQLETQGASGVNFKSGSYTQAILANVGLTSTTTIDSGAVVAGVTINSNVAASGVTATGGLYGLYITQKTAGLLDFTSGIYIESASSTTGITIMNTTTGLSIAGTATDGILIGGACTDAIHISGTNTTNAIHISGDQAVGILFDVDSSIATGISFAVDTGTTMTTGIDMTCTGTGTITNAISLTYTASATECLAVTLATGQTITTGMSLSGAGTYTTGILLDATALGTGLKISGATTTAIDITGACTRGIRLGTHDWGVGLTGLVLSTTDPLFQVAGRIAASNSTAGVYACAYKQLALTSATQNTDTSWFADWNELYITPTTTTTLTGSSHYAAVKGHVEVSGTVVSSTGVTASLWGSNIIPAGYTNNGIIAGCYVDGIIHTSMTNTGDTMAYGIGAHTDPNQGDWEYGLYMPASTVTTGIYIAGSTTGLNVTSTTQGIYANVTAVAAAGSLTGSALCVYGAGQAGLNDVGIVAYLDATAKGLSTGNWTYGAGIWLNIDSTFAHAVDPKGWADHEQLCPLSVGVYAPSAVGAGIDDNDIIYGIKAELVGDATAPTSNGCYFAALNVSQTAATQTAIFFAHQDAAVGLTTAKTTAGGAIALACVNGTMYYVNVYTS